MGRRYFICHGFINFVFFFAWPIIKRLDKELCRTDPGGAVLLGCNGLVFKLHGSTREDSVEKVVTFISEVLSSEHDMIKTIEKDINNVDIEIWNCN